jgi:hypothetical protein
MKAIDLRVREDTLALARALCVQRNLERAALLREALEVGLLLLAASGPPAAGEPPDTYGTVAGLRLAQLLRPRLAPALDFLSHHSATPLATLPASPRTSTATPPLQQVLSGVHQFPLDDAVSDVLDAFGVGALGDDP